MPAEATLPGEIENAIERAVVLGSTELICAGICSMPFWKKRPQPVNR
jgi:hypothetical protein